MSLSLGNTIRVGSGVDIERVETPLEPKSAWEIEAFLLRIFEYGDYSFRSALRGEYSDTLDCTFALAKRSGSLVGAAGCLCSHQHPTVAVVGPVGVHPEHRRRGIGAALLRSLADHLAHRSCTAAYLGVSPENPAVGLYRKVGFRTHHGIVMRLALDSEGDFDQINLQEDRRVSIRRVCWGDFPAVGALLSYPGSMYTYDLRRSLFSSKYVPPTRFLSVFPDMMKAFSRHGGFANVLVAGNTQHVVGIAQANRLPSAAQQHVAELDFYVHDNFVEHAHSLVERTLRECSTLSVRRINGCCLSCDRVKQRILDKLGGRQTAVLPERAFIGKDDVDVLIYELEHGL